jgi:hypothetical protein
MRVVLVAIAAPVFLTALRQLLEGDPLVQDLDGNVGGIDSSVSGPAETAGSTGVDVTRRQPDLAKRPFRGGKLQVGGLGVAVGA